MLHAIGQHSSPLTPIARHGVKQVRDIYLRKLLGTIDPFRCLQPSDLTVLLRRGSRREYKRGEEVVTQVIASCSPLDCLLALG